LSHGTDTLVVADADFGVSEVALGRRSP